MHRSGTSCLTGCLENYGLYLGDVINQSPFNAKGNKENKKMWMINDLVLSQSGGAWDQPPQQLTWNNEARSLRDQFIESYDVYDVWGFKDPRCVLTLPFWLEALPNMKFAATYRHPVSVAESLRKRAKFPFEQSLSLWAAYNRIIIELATRYTFPVICFDWNADEYLERVKKIADTLGISNTTPVQQSQFFDSALISHQRPSLTEDSVAREYLIIYKKLSELSNTGIG